MLPAALNPARRTLAALALLPALLLPASTAAADDRETQDRVVPVTGVADVEGVPTHLEVIVAVEAGESARAVKRAALRAQRAVAAPAPEAAAYTRTGLEWDEWWMGQRYNPAGEPRSPEGYDLSGAGELQATHGTWNDVAGSDFAFAWGGWTSTCPSLTQGCGRRQYYDGNNDVGWGRLANGTLGVTWYSTLRDEADMVLNARYPWSTGCTNRPDAIDLRSVLLHENGHAAGLGHSSDRNAVMYPSYQSARCELGADDEAGLSAIYPASRGIELMPGAAGRN